MHALVVERALRDLELLEDVSDVRLDRLRRDIETLRDPAVGEALRHQCEHLPLARRQLVERIRAAPTLEQRRDQLWIDDDAARDDARDRVRQLVHVEYAVLEQVPDPLLIAVEEPERILGLDVLREHEEADVFEARPDLRGGPQALVGERRRKTDVDEDGIGLLALDDVEQLARGLGLPDELEPRAAEEAPQALADEQRVLGDGEPQRHYEAATAA